MAEEHEISVSFPARPEFLRLARLATADAASRAGFDYEEIDDLRMAVSELCMVVAGPEASGTLTLEFRLAPHAVTVRGVATPGAVTESELSRTIVAALVDDYDLAAEGDAGVFHLTKRTDGRADAQGGP